MINELVDWQLVKEFKKVLLKERLISDDDIFDVQNIYTKQQRGKAIQHYIITIPRKKEKFFIRMLKEKDNSFHVMPFLKDLANDYKNSLPIALTKPFIIGKNTYTITSYIEGDTLEFLLPNLTDSELKQVAFIINEKLQRMHSVEHSKYSLGNEFCNRPFNEILYVQIEKQFYENECIYSQFNFDPEMLLDAIRYILNRSFFSKPTLVHMDIKPANIIISSNDVILIDYELSRFADIDYEWVNLLIKTLHSYDKRFIQYVLDPIIQKNFISLEQAIKNEKHCVYLLYLSLNMYIYYFKSNRFCPQDIIKLANIVLEKLENIDKRID